MLRERAAAIIARLRALLPATGQAELDGVLDDARDLDVDRLAIGREVVKANIVPTDPLPAHLADIDAGSGGRWFELSMSVNPCDADAMQAVRTRYVAECERVAAMIATGTTSPADAWRRIRPIARRRLSPAALRAKPTPVPVPSSGPPPLPERSVSGGSPPAPRANPQPPAPTFPLFIGPDTSGVRWIGGEFPAHIGRR